MEENKETIGGFEVFSSPEELSASMSAEPQQTETLEVIYKRIAYEVSNPSKQAGMFEIDGKLYHLIRIPHTGASQFWDWQ